MTKLESEIRHITKSDTCIFNYLQDFNNFENLMPDRVTDWESTTETCRFTIQGMTSLGMKIIERQGDSYIKIKDDGKVPFSFFLNVHIKKIDYNSSNVNLIFDADLNPMLKMMASTPLTNFLNMLLDKLEELEF